MELTIPPARTAWNRAFLPWFGLVCIWGCFAAAVIRVQPANFFGLTQDDSIYFSSAKALAQGRGYILPSFPGAPAATKYPVLYPWILSWVWRWNPWFPANLRDAIGVNVAFGICYITAIFLFLRRMKGIGELEAFIITAFCGLHPQTVFYTASLLSDMPFAAFALTAIALAEKAAGPKWRSSEAIISGLFAGLAVITRAFGVPVALGILLVLVWRRAWRPAALFGTCLAPFFTLFSWRILFSRPAVSPVSGPAALNFGWVQTWAYYASYVADWKQGVPNSSILAAMMKDNSISLVRAPAEYFVSRLPGANVFIVAILIAIVTLFLLKGIVKLVREHELRCFHWVLFAYVITAMLWNYALASRFLILFLPLFAVALWVEGKGVVGMLYTTLARGNALEQKAIAAALGVGLAFGCAWSVRSLARMWEVVTERSGERAALLPEKQEAYAWLVRSTQPKARVIAYEDASLYLYSGRAAVRPVTFPTVVAYDPSALTKVLEHMTDVSRAICADYWLVSEDDYIYEWRPAYLGYRERVEMLEQRLPLVFKSRNGHTRIYSLSSVQQHGSLDLRDDSCYSQGSLAQRAVEGRGLNARDSSGGNSG